MAYVETRRGEKELQDQFLPARLRVWNEKAIHESLGGISGSFTRAHMLDLRFLSDKIGAESDADTILDLKVCQLPNEQSQCMNEDRLIKSGIRRAEITGKET